jgi:hypothetical protein
MWTHYARSSSVPPATNAVVHRVLLDGDFIVNHSLLASDSGPVGVRFDH